VVRASRGLGENFIYLVHALLEVLEQVSSLAGVLHLHHPSGSSPVSSWREDGEHYAGVRKLDSPLLRIWDSRIDIDSTRPIPVVNDRIGDDRFGVGLNGDGQAEFSPRLNRRLQSLSSVNGTLLSPDDLSDLSEREEMTYNLPDGVERIMNYNHSEALSALANRHIVFIGDSITRNQFYHLCYWLDTGERRADLSGPYVNIGGREVDSVEVWDPARVSSVQAAMVGTTHDLQMNKFIKASNITLQFVFIKEAWTNAIADKVDSLVEDAHGPDALVFNSGVWDVKSIGAAAINTACNPMASSSQSINAYCEYNYAQAIINIMSALSRMDRNGKAGLWKTTTCCGQPHSRQPAVNEINNYANAAAVEKDVTIYNVYPYVNTLNIYEATTDGSHMTSQVYSLFNDHLITLLEQRFKTMTGVPGNGTYVDPDRANENVEDMGYGNEGIRTPSSYVKPMQFL